MKKLIFFLIAIFFISFSFTSAQGYYGRGYGSATFKQEGQRKVVNRSMNRHGHVGKGHGPATRNKSSLKPKMYYYKRAEPNKDLAKTSDKKMNHRGFFGSGGQKARND